MDLLDRVRQTIRRHDLVPVGTRVAVALSGGSDSVALTYVLRELDAAGELVLAGLAHFNHQLRTTAAADEAFSERLAASLDLPLYVGRGDVPARARTEKRSVEDA